MNSTVKKVFLIRKSHHKGLLLLPGLEATMAELGGGVDELEVDLLQSAAAGLDQQRLEEDFYERS